MTWILSNGESLDTLLELHNIVVGIAGMPQKPTNYMKNHTIKVT